MSKKILYIATVQSHICQFHIPMLKKLKQDGWEVHVAAKDNLSEKRGLILNEPHEVFDVPFSRNPINKNNIIAYKQVRDIIRTKKYDVIHCHTPMGSVIGRIAGKVNKVKTIIYTAHGFHFYKGAPIKNWIMYYPVEYILSKFTDILITINKEDYEIAKLFKAKKLMYIPGVGVNTEKFNSDNIDIDSVEIRKELGISKEDFIVLSIGELNKNKNHESIIKAISMLKDSNIKYIICGNGPLDKYLIDLADKLNVSEQVILLGYRRDIAKIGKMADIFCFPSFREGLSVSVMEMMASGLPIICSKIRGNTDLIDHEKGGYLVDPTDIVKFAQSIKKLKLDSNLRNNMSNYNKEKVKMFSELNVIYNMSEVYNDII